MKLQQCQSRRQLNWKFESFFGAWPFYCVILWNALRRSRLLEKGRAPPIARVNPWHFLMGLHFLKAYNTEERSAVTFGCDEQTFRQWAWFILLSIIAKLDTKFVCPWWSTRMTAVSIIFVLACCLTTAHLRCSCFFLVYYYCPTQIRWENQFWKYNGNRATVCVDGIHFKIFKPSPFCKDWNSHKLGGAALSYELVLTCIAAGDIVAYNGPFPDGKWNDIKIFRNKTKWQLKEAEWPLGDLGYTRGRDRKTILTEKVDARDRQHSYAMGCARDRHETVNRQLRQWAALNGAYRHDRWKHHDPVFRASCHCHWTDQSVLVT